MPSNIPFYSGLDETDRARLLGDVQNTYEKVAAAVVSTTEEEDDDTIPAPPTTPEAIEIPESADLIGIDPAVYRQIQAALRAGKQHLMFYGPPGTGKTSLARNIAAVLHTNWRLITGSADWTSQDVIGGYQPVGDGKIAFVPGVLLRDFDRPLIIDELNRCDIDKVIGPLFTVLGGHATTLPYRVDVTSPASPQYVILPQPKPSAAEHEFAPTTAWRIIATINSIDKASLYQMSYALTRRFGWIYVDAPKDLDAFLVELLRRKNFLNGEPVEKPVLPLADVWRAVNEVRVVGAAPFIDIVKTAIAINEEFDFLTAPNTDAASIYLDGFYMYLLPMLDGILRQEAEKISLKVAEALGLGENHSLSLTLKERLISMAV
jgi:5-methylcytosine-specific restriction protein B